MKNRPPRILTAVLVIACLIINSCKKTDNSNIPNLLTGGVWQLASLQVINYTGDSNTSTDTLNTNCDLTQLLSFKNDNTCSYTNFDCKPQPTAAGKWELTSNKLFLSSDITCQDNTSTGKLQPFLNAQIINLGQFSLVLQTGDIQNYYTSVQKRTIRRYGFIRQKTTVN